MIIHHSILSINLSEHAIKYNPNISHPIISVSALTSEGFTIIFKENSTEIIKNNIIIFTAKRENKLYLLNLNEFTQNNNQEVNILTDHQQSSLQELHRILGHTNVNLIKNSLKNNLISGIKVNKNEW